MKNPAEMMADAARALDAQIELARGANARYGLALRDAKIEGDPVKIEGARLMLAYRVKMLDALLTQKYHGLGSARHKQVVRAMVGAHDAAERHALLHAGAGN